MGTYIVPSAYRISYYKLFSSTCGYVIVNMATKTSRVHNTIHWFRKGLRLHDNQSLMEACETSVILRPVFFIDPDYVKHGNMGFNRWRFLIESLNDINDSLEKIGSR